MLQLFRAFILLVTFASYALAQDTTSVTFTEENSIVGEQRFIDRYENVFMTKIQTRLMFKLGYLATTYNGLGLHAAFEYKVSPAWSLEATLFSRTNRIGDAVTLERFERQLSGNNLFGGVRSRWYFDMTKRIAKEQSASNFTGSYLALAYERSLTAIQSDRPREHFSMAYGFQSRFLASGFLDFSLGVYYVTPYLGLWDHGYLRPGFRIGNAVIASRSLIGFAFGDWKRNGKEPLCDVLHCDYYVKQHFKIRLPEINIGIYDQSARLELGYERKLGKSPLSVNLSVWNETSHKSFGDGSLWNATLIGEAQLRWYYLQKRQVRRGKASDNLSGLYVGPLYAYNFNHEQSYNYNYNQTARVKWSFSDISPSWGAITGYQQRLFNRLYFDATVGFYATSFESSLFKIRYGELKAKAGIGFAF